MKLTKFSSAVVALAISAIYSASTQAAPINTAGDLIIGFQQTGAANSYEVDLGSVTQFINPASSTLTFNLSTSDLSNTFTNWNSNNQGASNVQWGVIGASNKFANGDLTLGSVTLAPDTLFYTTANATPPTERSHASQETNVLNVLSGLDNTFANASVSSGSTNSLPAVNIAASTLGSFAYENGTKANFGLTGPINTVILTSTTTGPIGPTLALYQVTPTNADLPLPTTLLGNFSLGNDGVLTFSAAAVPEPSTYALMGLGASLLFWRLRRKTGSI